jgi:hypothetical protein
MANSKGQWLETTYGKATIGEISDALRDVFGEYRESVVL